MSESLAYYSLLGKLTEAVKEMEAKIIAAEENSFSKWDRYYTFGQGIDFALIALKKHIPELNK